MTVRQLTELLALEDPNMRVVVDGYESGYDEPVKIRYVNIIPNLHKEDNEKDDNWWDGEFKETLDRTAEIALVLPRKS
jgi:hypothetical protein